MNTVTFTEDETARLVKILETIRDLNIDECKRLETFVDRNPEMDASIKRITRAKRKRHTEASMNAVRLLNKIWGRPSPASVFGVSQ